MMKKLFIIYLVPLVFFVGCQKPLEDFREIVFDCGLMDISEDTKASPVTSVSGTYYWGATTGGNSAGSAAETVQWATTSATVSSNKIATGKMMIGTSTYYNYYVANANFTAGGDMTVSGNGNDIVVARVYNSNNATPSISLNHIFARTGSLTLNVPSGYTASNVSWQIISNGSVTGTAGTYSMRQQAWTASSARITSRTNITSSSDLWLIPGSYDVYLSFTLTNGTFSHAYLQKGTISLQQGKINNIQVTCTSDDKPVIKFSVSVASWSESTPVYHFPRL